MRPYGEENLKSNCSVPGHGSKCIVSDETSIRGQDSKHLKHHTRFLERLEVDRELEEWYNPTHLTEDDTPLASLSDDELDYYLDSWLVSKSTEPFLKYLKKNRN